jgi:hypothetical protein
MIRTKILCPNCFKKKILTMDNKEAHCDGCGTEFIIVDLEKNTIRYK